MGSSSTPSRTTQTTEPPEFIKPYMQYGAQEAQRAYQAGGPQYYPGNTVVPFAPQTERALGMTEQRAINGSPVTQAAQKFATDTLNSPMTSQFGSVSNPYLDQTFNRAADSVQNRLSTMFAGSGRNIDASRNLAAQELGDLSNTIYGGAYDAERNRMLSDLTSQRGMRSALTGFAPTLAAQDYIDINQLGGVGQQVEDLTGRLMQDSAARWDFSQNQPQINLDNYLSRIGGAFPGSSTTQTTPLHRNRAAGALGGAGTGAMMGSMFGPWGALIGGAAGGLLGAF